MKNILLGVLTFLVTLSAILVFVAQRMPTDYQIEAVEIMETTPDAIFGKIANLKEWPSWSPWKQTDPSMTFDFSKSKDTFASVGDSFAWTGKDGSGIVKITDVSSNSLLRYDLIMPGMSTPSCFFSISSAEGKTSLYWSMKGSRTFFEKIIWRFLGIENDIKTKLTAGLTNIRTQLEKK